ncbi:MAG: pilus assembly protein CpaE, partial [Alphaproteobacteria bacterium]|nr:pilus assembly protein CpaE [Alphaproteobacteria bacterium]
MNNAFAPRPVEDFEDEFDLDMGYVASGPAAGHAPHSGDEASAPYVTTPGATGAEETVRPPLQFTPPAVAPAAAPAHAGRPVESQIPAVAGFNPVGDLVAGASAAFSPPVQSGGGPEVSVPRIAIHVFAERQDTLAAAERAGQDRRLSRATTQIRVGGVAAAVEAYQHEPTPPLIIVECLKDPQTLLWEVDQLAEVCDAGTKVVVVGATNDILLFRELMRRGVSEYLVAPLQPLQLIAAIGGLFSDPAQPFVGRSIAFVGARGGAGSSSVAHNTAYAMSERIGANTVIVDY